MNFKSKFPSISHMFNFTVVGIFEVLHNNLFEMLTKKNQINLIYFIIYSFNALHTFESKYHITLMIGIKSNEGNEGS